MPGDDSAWQGIGGAEIAVLVPHAPPVLALDSIVSADESSLHARITVRQDSAFCESDAGVPVWVGLEYMGQAVAALEGIRARRSGQPVPVGYLLGTRQFVTTIQFFPVGAVLNVTVREVHSDPGGLAVVDGAISGDGIELECRFSVFKKGNDGVDANER
jgi:predicted hotdog family 3-hydroxylacyl-ACP dehydratase